MANSNVVVDVKNLVFSYDDVTNAIDDVSFQINENEYVCIIGHNGSGKSTISKILVGLLKPKSGSIKIYDEEISFQNLDTIRKKIGIIFQNPDNQFIGLNGRIDIAFGLENRKINEKYMDDIIDYSSNITDVASLLDKDSDLLSGGQKQKIAITSTLAMNPNIVIFDESTSMLDPLGKNNLKAIMLMLKNKAKKTVISITHDMNEVINADKVIVFKNGKIIKVDTPKEVFSDDNFLKTTALDLPFISKLSFELKKLKVIDELEVDKKSLINKLCQKKK